MALALASPSFGICFIGKTCSIAGPPSPYFSQVDATHWILDVSSTVTSNFLELKEVALFLFAPNALPPDAALALYVSVGGADWSYKGNVSNVRASEVMPLAWPEPPYSAAPGTMHAQIGLSIEPLAEASAKQGATVAAKEEFCKRVGLDLFQYLQSFAGVGSVGPDKLLVPSNALDKWYTRITNRLQRDPDFLTRHKDMV